LISAFTAISTFFLLDDLAEASPIHIFHRYDKLSSFSPVEILGYCIIGVLRAKSTEAIHVD
jgi:hypothetical protein